MTPAEAALSLIEQIQGHICHRIERINEARPHALCADPDVAAMAELNALVGDIQNMKAECARELRRKGFMVPHVPTVEAIILAEEAASGQ
jgi:hypothetical protein